VDLATRLYALLLHLYPSRFRAEFAEEMGSVFAATAAEAAEYGAAAVGLACWRELRDAPGAIIHACWRERRHMMNTPSLERASRWGVLAALVVFPLAAIPRREEIPQVLQIAVFLVLFGGAAIQLVFGAVKGLPVWSLPSFGFFLAGLTLWGVWQGLGRSFMSLFPPYWPDALYPILDSASLCLGLLAVLIALVAIAAVLPPLRPFWLRLQRDWTLLSFVVFGAAPISLYLTFDEYRYEGPYVLASMLLMAVGVWLYLRSSRHWQRWLALLTALTLAMGTAAIAKWLILPNQDWPGLLGGRLPEARRWSEVLPTLAEWGWIMVVMTAPALLRLLPQPRQVNESP
jgi:hypothetical protein